MIILGMVLSLVIGLSLPASAEEVSQMLMRLQDRLNDHITESILGAVDYELVYMIPGHTDQVTFLEEEPAHSSEEIEAAMKALPVGTVLPPPPPRQTKEQLPSDLSQANVAILKARFKLPAEVKETLYLSVRPPKEGSRYLGERLSLAESELGMMDRRQLRWDTQEMFRHWPIGSILFLEPVGTVATGDVADIPVRWSFRRPGPPPFDKPEIIASGEVNLSLRKVGGEWKVSHIEQLIAALRAKVVSVQ